MIMVIGLQDGGDCTGLLHIYIKDLDRTYLWDRVLLEMEGCDAHEAL